MARHRRRGRPKGLKFPHGYKKHRRKHGKVGRPKGLKFPHGYKTHRKGKRGRPQLGFKRVGTYLGNALFVRR